MTIIQVGVLYFLAGVVGPLSIELTIGEGETAIWFVSTNGSDTLESYIQKCYCSTLLGAWDGACGSGASLWPSKRYHVLIPI